MEMVNIKAFLVCFSKKILFQEHCTFPMEKSNIIQLMEALHTDESMAYSSLCNCDTYSGFLHLISLCDVRYEAKVSH